MKMKMKMKKKLKIVGLLLISSVVGPVILESWLRVSGLLWGWQMAIRTSAIRTSRAASGSTSGLTSGRDMVAVSGKTKRAVTRSTPLVSPSKYSKGDIVGEMNKE